MLLPLLKFIMSYMLHRSDGTKLEPMKWEHLKLAKALMFTCHQMYAVTPSRLAPHVAVFDDPGREPQTKTGVRSSRCVECLTCLCRVRLTLPLPDV